MIEIINVVSAIKQYDTEINIVDYDDYREHNIDITGSKGLLMCVVSDLNNEFPDLRLRERDIQETGANCLLRFTIYDYDDL